MPYEENAQSAYHTAKFGASGSVDRDIFEAMRRYLVEDLGRGSEEAFDRARSEISREIPRAVLAWLSRSGISIEGKTVLDLGAGLGGMSEELMLRGASVLAVEPGAAFADIAKRRLERHDGSFRVIQAFGESLPMPDQSVDLVVSWRVLEHVRQPRQVLAEVWRVLRPGGQFYLSCENYLAFREAHYGVAWFPLLPKTLGAVYLRMRGRSPCFLQQAVTYTTYPRVLRDCRELGFVRRRDEEIAESLRTKPGTYWQTLRLLSKLTDGSGPLVLDRLSKTFSFGLTELFRKPA
ncbi:MAG TPA: class I SAM-dependent methyltransferase [Casimicrobiaceae bacterium]|nr:class I SAM-dependent methyltransferase [Casimicrobiaceae bacterium]